MTGQNAEPLHATPRLYRDLAEWYPLLTPPEDYAEEAGFYLQVFRDACVRPPRTLLDLGCGGGHNTSHLKRHLAATLVDLSPKMLELSRALNPECEHVEGDMRTLRLGRQFDCVLIHDAVGYMTSPEDLSRAIATAFLHCAPGGAAQFQPDFVRETFAPGTETGGTDAGARGMRYLEWWWDPDPVDDTYFVEMAYLLRGADGAVEVAHDRHVMGLFPRTTWLELIAAAGFEPRAVPFEHSASPHVGRDVFLGLKPSGLGVSP
jgi:SAM-dependent methyltransferase